jgi:pyrimidine operon attenuation protein/uracil phosphoribosyltransferase
MNELIEKTLVLNSAQINQKIKRMAFEVFENNPKEKSLLLAGIDGQGHAFAKLLAKEIRTIAGIEVDIIKVSVDKLAVTQCDVIINAEATTFKKRVVILVDDVMNSGRTLAYAMKPFLETGIKKLEVAVLVNRSHTLFPIMPTYTGYELATTLTDHVKVSLGKQAAVYLL